MMLERSGVGDVSYLSSLGTRNIVSNLHGVRNSFKDHHVVVGPTAHVDIDEDDTMDDIQRSKPKTMDRVLKQYENGQAALASNYIDVAVEWRP
jgi:hypothetical protein